MNAIYITATAPFETLTELRDGQQIRIPGSCWSRAITVGTPRGSRTKNHRIYKQTPEAEIPALVEAELDDCKARWAARGEVYPMEPYAIQHSAVLCDNYPGKAERLAAEETAFHAAPIIQDGQCVIIEGEKWRVKILGLQYSDPVHFDRI